METGEPKSRGGPGPAGPEFVCCSPMQHGNCVAVLATHSPDLFAPLQYELLKNIFQLTLF